jgi:hypothetical protein
MQNGDKEGAAEAKRAALKGRLNQGMSRGATSGKKQSSSASRSSGGASNGGSSTGGSKKKSGSSSRSSAQRSKLAGMNGSSTAS